MPMFLCMQVQVGATMAEVPLRRMSRIVSREAHWAKHCDAVSDREIA